MSNKDNKSDMSRNDAIDTDKQIYFFATCIGAAACAGAAMNGVRLLQREGLEVIFKKDQSCCGQPSYNSGYYEESRKVALYTMDLFEKNAERKQIPIIVPSGSCAGMMRVDYAELFAGTPHEERAIRFSKRIFELSEYLDKILGVRYEDTGMPVRVTWHSNCHALRVAKCVDSAKTLLRSLRNVELIELAREEECCGFGGTFSIKESEISHAMVCEKIEDIKAKEVEYLISADAGCLLNITGAMRRQGVGVRGVHLYDFIASRIGI